MNPSSKRYFLFILLVASGYINGIAQSNTEIDKKTRERIITLIAQSLSPNEESNTQLRSKPIIITKEHPRYVDPKTIPSLFDAQEMLRQRGEPTSGKNLSTSTLNAFRKKIQERTIVSQKRD